MTHTIEVFRARTGEILTTRPTTPVDELDAMFDQAERTRRQWTALSASARAAIIGNAARVVLAARDELVDLEFDNTGKPPSDCGQEVDRCAAALSYYGGWADKILGTTVPLSSDHLAYTVRESLGTVVGITPWNVGMRMAAKKAAQAIAFGNACLLKPAPQTPLTTLRFEALLTEAGVPEGLVQVALGDADVGAALVSHERTALISFTGSTENGRHIAAVAGERLTPVVMELGGKSPQVVFSDADLDEALEGVLLGVYRSTGQMCIAGSRLYVQQEIVEEFTARLAERVTAMQVGDTRRDDIHVGPMITAPQKDKVALAIGDALADGNDLVAQASLPDDPQLAQGFFVAPTLFQSIHENSALMREEIFGPVLAVSSFSDESDALRKAMDTRYGLAAGIWTRDGARAHRMARDIPAGVIWLNAYGVLGDQLPFGGNAESGSGRENGDEAQRVYSRVKSVVMELDARKHPYRL